MQFIFCRVTFPTIDDSSLKVSVLMMSLNPYLIGKQLLHHFTSSCPLSADCTLLPVCALRSWRIGSNFSRITTYSRDGIVLTLANMERYFVNFRSTGISTRFFESEIFKTYYVLFKMRNLKYFNMLFFPNILNPPFIFDPASFPRRGTKERLIKI